MQHTVIAFFDTYAAAEEARDALVATGIARTSITLQARCEPTYATDATTVVEPPHVDEGLLASIERFFESLFASEPPRCETAQYAEAVRRGAVLLSVDTVDDAQCDAVRAALAARNPMDIEERAATWSAPADEAMRERSPLEELGFRRSTTGSSRGTVRSYAREERAAETAEPAPAVAKDIATSEADAMAVAAGAAPGMGAVFAGRRSEVRPQDAVAPSGATVTPSAPSASPSSVPDEYLQEEEHFHGSEGGGEQ